MEIHHLSRWGSSALSRCVLERLMERVCSTRSVSIKKDIAPTCANCSSIVLDAISTLGIYKSRPGKPHMASQLWFDIQRLCADSFKRHICLVEIMFWYGAMTTAHTALTKCFYSSIHNLYVPLQNYWEFILVFRTMIRWATTYRSVERGISSSDLTADEDKHSYYIAFDLNAEPLIEVSERAGFF